MPVHVAILVLDGPVKNLSLAIDTIIYRRFTRRADPHLPPGCYYRKRGSASYIVREVLSVREREREREIQTDRDGSDVTILALKLAMNSHFPLPKIRNWR